MSLVSFIGRWTRLYKKNDAAAVAALFTKDALLLEPHGVFS